MATTYAELQAEIADYLNRDDLTSVLPTFIQHGEAQLNRDLRHFKMQIRADATADDRYVTLPADWLETIRVVNTGATPANALNLMSYDEMLDKRYANNDATGTPMYYAHIGGEIELYPTPDASTTIELTYYERIPALSDTNTTNWLLDFAPDLYLYASLLETAIYLRDDERLVAYSALYQQKLDALMRNSRAATHSGSGLKLNIRSY